MSVPLANTPVTPLNLATAPVIGNSAAVVATTNFTSPSSATYLTGLNANIVVPSVGNFIRVSLLLSSVTGMTAAATITLSIYSGATAGTLTTLQQSTSFVLSTGQTTLGGLYEFIIPVTATGTTFPQAGSTTFLSAAVTASSGNFNIIGAATTPAQLVIEVL